MTIAKKRAARRSVSKRTATKVSSAKTRASVAVDASVEEQVASVLATLAKRGSKTVREEMVTRYGIQTKKAFGVPMAEMQREAKRLGKSHELARALWDTGWYEARTIASFVDEPDRVTAAQMDRWCADFDNWAICDTACFHLFDRTPHAFRKVEAWSRRPEEFVKRASFALLACLALHDAKSDDASFEAALQSIEDGATDERNFVKKAVAWALRAVGGRNHALHASAARVAERLADSPDRTARAIGKAARKELASPALLRRLEPSSSRKRK